MAIVLVASPVISQIINVPGDQPYIQAGIDSASNGDTIHCASDCDSIKVTYLTLETPPPGVEVDYVTICEGEPVPDFIAIGENIQWYDDADLSNLIYSGDTLKTGHTVAGTYQYYVTQTIAGLTSSAVMATLSIGGIPQSPIVKDTACCEGEYVDYLIAESHYDYIRWYSDPELTNVLTYSEKLYVGDITEPGTYNFYVTSTIDCESLPDTVSYTINPFPQLPLAEDVAICENESIALLVAKGENITWYRDTDNNIIDWRDGQEYKGVEIGNQVWMAENLNYYTPSSSWYYNDDSSTYAGIYGRLYDFWTARKVCPSGWHLPGYNDWVDLIDFLGGDSIAAGKLKEQGLSHWISPNSGATNESGFAALPAGSYNIEVDTFISLGEEANFWSSQFPKETGVTYKLTSNSSEITQKRFYYTVKGASVRCIKDSIPDMYDIIHFGDTLVLSDIQAGTFPFYVTQTISNCEGPSTMATLTIHPVPEAPEVADIRACEVEEIPDLLATGENIRWYADAGLTSLISSGNNLPTGQTQEGVYPYFSTQTVMNCQSPADTAYLHILSSPIVDLGNDLTISIHQDLILSIGLPDYLYLWSDGSDSSRCVISGAELGQGEHTYWVVVSDTNSCTASDTIVITVVDPTNTAFAPAGNSFRIYPNPANSLVTIEAEHADHYSINITSLNGQLIYSTTIEGSSHQLDLSTFQKGVYFITIRSKDLITTRKIIKL